MAHLKITNGVLQLSKESKCPFQYLKKQVNPVTCTSDNFGNTNVTQYLKDLCNGKLECSFNFNQLPILLCIDDTYEVFELPHEFTSIRVAYECVLPRKRMRPFSNKRYDSKFKSRIFTPLKKLSINNLMKVFN
ncbi:unnamed protein product [Brachionus calyciflorus]|uniref:Uncharacterized protein n=1 Tax=Brachionus calyciflorus TaxID=104777 RepID=A0A814DNX9_9BILA|nr:unnamed protein product [Brachionus calyciflorus]